jgi:hypothetical protein
LIFLIWNPFTFFFVRQIFFSSIQARFCLKDVEAKAYDSSLLFI